jgi:DNA polymerase (family 10)
LGHRLFLPDDVLAKLDWVVASIHGSFKQSSAQMTERLLRAIRNPFVRLIAHPTARMLQQRPSIEFDIDTVFAAAKEHGVALELNASPERLDLSDVLCRRAKEMNIPICINSDSHAVRGFDKRFGISQARRAWLEKADVVNAKTWKEFERWIKAKKA